MHSPILTPDKLRFVGQGTELEHCLMFCAGLIEMGVRAFVVCGKGMTCKFRFNLIAYHSARTKCKGQGRFLTWVATISPTADGDYNLDDTLKEVADTGKKLPKRNYEVVHYDCVNGMLYCVVICDIISGIDISYNNR